HTEIAHEHPGWELREVLPEDVLAGPPLRRTAGEDAGQATDHLGVLRFRPAALLGLDPERLDRLTRRPDLAPQSLLRSVPRPAGVAQAPALGGVGLEPALQ